MRCHTVVGSPLGDLTLVVQDGALTRVAMQTARHGPVDGDLGQRDDAALAEAAGQLGEYSARERTGFDLPLAAQGTTSSNARGPC